MKTLREMMDLIESAQAGVAEGSKYKCSCHPGDPDPDCPVHGLEPMEVGDALDVKKGVAEAKSDDPDYDETLKRFKKGLPPKKKQDVAEEQVEESTPDALAKIDDLFRK